MIELLAALSLGTILGVLIAGRFGTSARQDSFIHGMAYGLQLAAEAAREAANDVVGAEHREGQLRAAREGRQ